MPDLTAVILAGGLGTRLQPAVAGRPKVLAPVLGRPFITFLLDQIAAAGIRSAVLCTGYLGDQVRAELGGSYAQVRLAYAQEEEPLGTGGALRNALPLIEGETLLAMNGDTYAEADWDDFYARHRAWGSRVTLLLAALAPGAEAPGYAYEAPPGLTQPASSGFRTRSPVLQRRGRAGLPARLPDSCIAPPVDREAGDGIRTGAEPHSTQMPIPSPLRGGSRGRRSESLLKEIARIGSHPAAPRLAQEGRERRKSVSGTSGDHPSSM